MDLYHKLVSNEKTILPLTQGHYEMISGKTVFDIPFQIIRTRWNSIANQANQKHNGKISKAISAMFKIHRT